MKAFIIGLFSLALLASGAALAHDLPDTAVHPSVSASGSTCGANGVFVIVVLQDGILLHKRCDSSTSHGSAKKGKNPALTGKAKAPLAGKPASAPLHGLGGIEKWKAPGESDPCYEWTVGGTSYVYCW